MALWKKESSNDGGMYVNLWPSEEFKFNDDIDKYKKDDKRANEYRMRGNMKFLEEIWLEAMEMYNKCLRFATDGSENISFAYGNRAACFLEMEMYDKCLDDIALAKNANYPQHLMSKLNAREALSLVQMRSRTPRSYRNTQINTKLSFDADEKYSCLANVLEIRTNDEFGKHIVAKKDIGVGANVLMDESFVADTNEFNNTCCKTCRKHTTNFIPCPGCTDVMFCNIDCMKANNIHKIACSSAIYRFPLFGVIAESILIGVTAFSSVDDLMIFVEHALTTKESIDLPKTISIAQMKYRLFLKIMTNPPKKSDENLLELYLMLMCIPEMRRMFDTQSKQRFLMHLLQQHMLILIKNGFSQNTVHGDEPIQIMGTITPFFNHSCYPNILITSFGNHLVGHIVRPVKKGEQLFSRYFHDDLPTEQQQAFLQAKYQFHCKCSKCLPSYNDDDRVQKRLDPSYVYAIRFDKDSIIKDENERPLILSECYKFMEKYGRLPWSNEIEEVMNRLKICLDSFSLEFNRALPPQLNK